ncbi:MAG: CoA ester lyase [Sphingomonadaceae bacterium]
MRPRRSCLFMPGANARALEKAKSLSADMVIFDLEDSVAPEAKEDARAAVCAAVQGGGYGAREVVVRCNGLDTDWGAQDIAAAVAAGPDGVLLPKVETPAMIAALDDALGAAGAKAELPLWVMIESPLAILNLPAIAAMGATTRLAGFVLGPNDLAKDMLAQKTPGRDAFAYAMSMVVTAARAYGLVPLDGVFNDFRDQAGLEAECRQGRMLGFEGKTLIHPAQLEITNRIFAPDPEEVEQAREVVAAFADPANAGKGVISVKGKMVELLHLEQAQRLLAFETAINA